MGQIPFCCILISQSGYQVGNSVGSQSLPAPLLTTENIVSWVLLDVQPYWKQES